jgi:hypothetical protein
MTRNRKADLQRKLAVAPVAKPPDGLADRIKNEIPNLLRFEPERERAHLRSSVAFNLRIAASIILLVSSLYLALHLFSRSDSNTRPVMMDERMVAPSPRPTTLALPSTPPEPGSALRRQAADLPTLPTSPPVSISSARAKDRVAEEKRAEADGMRTGTTELAGSVQIPAVAPEPIPEPIIVADAAPAPKAEPPVAVGGFAPERADERVVVTAKTAAQAVAAAQPHPAPALAAAPAPLRTRDTAEVRNFVALKEAITLGEEPRNVDVAAIVRHFSAPPSAPTNLRVELEASATPLDATKWLLRVSVDAPPTARAEITLTFGDAVAVYRALTGAPAPNETTLYEIEFNPNVNPDQTIASVHAGRVERTIRVSDLRQWNTASNRMKRASLAAAWARTLQSRTRADAIVAKAREAHIDELADLAERAERAERNR